MSTCIIGQPCVSTVMAMVEENPEPFILTPEVMGPAKGPLATAVTEPGPAQGPPIEHFIGRDELLAFMFNNDFPPITEPAAIPLPAAAWMLVAALGLLAALRKRN